MASAIAFEDPICPICRDSILDGNPVTNAHALEDSKVVHLFHKSCLEAWVNTGHPTCPLCNVVILDRRLLRSEEGRSRLLMEATLRGNTREIEMILTAGSIDATIRGDILSYFAENDQIALFDRVYEDRELISQEQLILLGSFAIYSNRPEILEIILRKSHLSSHERGQILVDALKVQMLIGLYDSPVELLDRLLADGNLDLLSHDLAVGFSIKANRPDYLLRLLPLEKIFFLKMKIQWAQWMQYDEIASLLSNRDLARPHSFMAHLEYKPMIMCMGLVQFSLGLFLIFAGFQIIHYTPPEV